MNSKYFYKHIFFKGEFSCDKNKGFIFIWYILTYVYL